jgi:hypothetical protein
VQLAARRHDGAKLVGLYAAELLTTFISAITLFWAGRHASISHALIALVVIFLRLIIVFTTIVRCRR